MTEPAEQVETPYKALAHAGIVLVLAAAIFALTAFLLLIAIGFDSFRSWLDRYSADGSADAFTVDVYGRIRLASIVGAVVHC